MKVIAPIASLLLLFTVSLPAQGEEIAPPISERFKEATVEETPSFQAHVLPLFGRLGCNGRACHGSFQGQGDFRLSLFGYDFKADHDALTKGTKEKPPRVDLANPLESLILKKPVDEAFHEGGKRFEVGSWQFHVLRRWIESGAVDDSENHAKLERLEVEPASILFQRDGDAVSLRAIAIWSDGTREDVTPLCRFQTNDSAIATISEEGVVASSGAGDTHVVVFYDNGVTPVPVLRPISAEIAASYPDVATPTKIDELIVAKLKTLGVVPSDIASDVEFLRRVSLDITGTLPTPEEVKAFVASNDPNKRTAKVNELLERPAYAAWWATKLCDLTGNNLAQLANPALRDVEAKQWHHWLEARLQQNMPYDEIVEGIVLAVGRREGQTFEEYCAEMSEYYRDRSGKSFAEHPTLPHYWTRRNMQKPEEKALSFAYAFLGVRLQCAECHKHPFDQWSKYDFDHFKAFFTNVTYRVRAEDLLAFQRINNEAELAGLRGAEQQRGLVTKLNEGKTVPFRELFVVGATQGRRRNRNPRNARAGASRVVTPKLLGGDEVSQALRDPREALMEWMRDPENPYFARAIVNRVWANYFHVGIVEPVDDLNLANPPSNGPLLDYLAEEFIASGYDLKHLHRLITSSDAYQRSWTPNETNLHDRRNFSRAIPRRMPAEVAYDAIRQATAGEAELASMQTTMENRMIGAASSARGGQAFLLTAFGKPQRLTNCECERSTEPSLLQTLLLRNDGELLGMIERNRGWVNEITRAESQQQQTLRNRVRAEVQRRSLPQVERQIEQVQRRIAQAGENAAPEQLAEMKRRLERLQQTQKRLAQADQQTKEAESEAKTPAFDPGDIIETAYLRTLSRYPTDEEVERCRRYFAEAPSIAAGAKDLLWALLNTKEFILNH